MEVFKDDLAGERGCGLEGADTIWAIAKLLYMYVWKADDALCVAS